ncbi:hypothetical protein V6N11_056239 [Hibiscus sabdariffa]|uniref:Uncharacterized protein n=1 Tax=Hibiscus sabdariffa TaxID=183260 RepID=A0ABR2T3V6_9ROSI
MSMEKLAESILGAADVKKPKWIGRSAWDTYRLSSEQVQYACVDAYNSISPLCDAYTRTCLFCDLSLEIEVMQMP